MHLKKKKEGLIKGKMDRLTTDCKLGYTHVKRKSKQAGVFAAPVIA